MQDAIRKGTMVVVEIGGVKIENLLFKTLIF